MNPSKLSRGIHILLADDDKDDRFFFKDVLSKLPIASHLTTVDDGERLMDYLTKNSSALPDVLFLDFNMPRRNGFECLMDIKASKSIRSLPVIMYSTSLYDSVADDLFRIGAHYYVRKTNLPNLSNVLLQVLIMLQNATFIRPARERFILHPSDTKAGNPTPNS